MFSFNRRQERAFENGGDAARQLSEKHLELAKQIASLERFICEAPARAAEANLERMETIPPPEGFQAEDDHDDDLPKPLSRLQVAEIRKQRRRNMLVCLVALALFAAAAHWLASSI